MAFVSLLALAAGCGGSGFAEVEAIEEDLRERVRVEVEGARSPGEASCLEREETEDRRVYRCQVQVFALRPRDDQIIRFRVVATPDGEVAVERLGVVTFD